MIITKIKLINFRNYDKIVIDKLSNLNIFIGSNGIGKTTILESIYMGSLTKTFKSNDDCSVINNKNSISSANIKIKLYDNFSYKNLNVEISKNGKKTSINDTPQRKLSDFVSQYNVILMSPDEVKLIKSSPNIRRNYFNIQLSQVNKEYIDILNKYNKLIKNKNEFLKKIMFNGNLDISYLDIVDSKISEYGYKIYNYRKKYIDEINIYLQKYFSNFEKGNVFIKYESDFENLEIEKINKLLLKNRNKDISFGMSNIGTHRDDFVFLHNDVNSKDYSSQGIQKLFVLAMKLSEIEIFKNIYDKTPIVLLDDLFSELDNKNRNKIFNALNRNLQIFITTTDLKNISKSIVNNAKVYNLDERK